MTIPEATPIAEQRPVRPISGGKKAVLIFAAGCGGMLMLVLATCGVGVGIGMFQAMLPPQVVITYRGGNSEYMQLYAKNVSGKPLTDLVVHARWRNLASARAEIRGTIGPGEDRLFDLHAQIDESKLNRRMGPLDAYTREEWAFMTSEEQTRAVFRLAKNNDAAERLNNLMLDEAFSKTPSISVITASGEEIRSKVIDASK